MHANCINVILFYSFIPWFWVLLLTNTVQHLATKYLQTQTEKIAFNWCLSTQPAEPRDHHSVPGCYFPSWLLFSWIFGNPGKIGRTNWHDKFFSGHQSAHPQCTAQCVHTWDCGLTLWHSAGAASKCPLSTERASVGDPRDPLLFLDTPLCIPLQIHPGCFWDRAAHERIVPDCVLTWSTDIGQLSLQ